MKTINFIEEKTVINEQGETYDDRYGRSSFSSFKCLASGYIYDQWLCMNYSIYYRITSDDYIQFTSLNEYTSWNGRIESQYKLDPTKEIKENIMLAFRRRVWHRRWWEGFCYSGDNEADFFDKEELEPVMEELYALAKKQPESDFLKFVESTGRDVRISDAENGKWRTKCIEGNHHMELDDGKELWYCGYHKRGGGKQELLDFIEECKKRASR